jgi:hypothetical protein
MPDANMDNANTKFSCNVDPSDVIYVQNDFVRNPVAHNLDLEFQIVGKNGSRYSVWLNRDSVKGLHNLLTDALHNSYENGGGEKEIQDAFNKLAKERLATPMNTEANEG